MTSFPIDPKVQAAEDAAEFSDEFAMGGWVLSGLRVIPAKPKGAGAVRQWDE